MKGSAFVEPLPSPLPLHQEIVLLLEAISDGILDLFLFLHALLNMAANVLVLQGEHEMVVEGLLSSQAHLRSLLFRQQFGSCLVRNGSQIFLGLHLGDARGLGDCVLGGLVVEELVIFIEFFDLDLEVGYGCVPEGSEVVDAFGIA